MSAFEFILILIAIVAGFAISEILAAWGRLVRARVSLRHAALYLASTAFLLALIVRYIWVLWIFNQEEWNFAAFLLAFAPIVVLALAAYVISVPRVSAPDVLGHYFNEARPFYYLLVLFLVLWTVSDLFNVPRYTVASLLPPGIGLALRSLAATGFLALAHAKKPVVHGVLLSLLFAVLAVVSAAFVPQL